MWVKKENVEACRHCVCSSLGSLFSRVLRWNVRPSAHWFDLSSVSRFCVLTLALVVVEGLFSLLHFLFSTPTLIRHLGGPVYWLCRKAAGYINICAARSQQCSLTRLLPLRNALRARRRRRRGDVTAARHTAPHSPTSSAATQLWISSYCAQGFFLFCFFFFQWHPAYLGNHPDELWNLFSLD